MIRAYVGLLGEGKTFSMVYDVLPILRQNKRVFSNLPIRLKQKDGTFLTSQYLPMKEFEKALREEYNALFVVDEASIVFPAQFWNKLNPEYIIKFAQARKYGLDIFYTTQRFTHTIKRLRDLTNEVVMCNKKKFFKWDYFVNKFMNPEYFDSAIKTDFSYRENLLKVRRILPDDVKQIYDSYDTMFMVQGSEMLGLDEGKDKIDRIFPDYD